jgi:hypothetical protein
VDLDHNRILYARKESHAYLRIRYAAPLLAILLCKVRQGSLSDHGWIPAKR